MRYVTILCTILLSLGSSATAQQVRGKVADVSTGQSLPGTLLVLVDADSLIRATTLSDSAGAFILHAPAGDTLRLHVQHVGYAPQSSVPIVLGHADTLQLQIGMRAQSIAVEGITVTATVNRNLERFLRNERARFGHFLGPEEITRLGRVP